MVPRLKIPPQLQQAIRVARRWWGYFPLSIPGLVLLSTIAAGTYYFGMKQSDYVLLLTGGVLLGAALLDLLLVVWSASFLSFSFQGRAQKSSFFNLVKPSAPPIIWLLVLAAGIYYAGNEHENDLIQNIAVVVFSASVLTALFTIFAALYYKDTLASKKGTKRIDLLSNTPGPSGRVLPRFLPPLVEASTHILEPDAFDCYWERGVEKKRHEWLVSTRRCLLEENYRLLRRVIVKDVLGFAKLDWEQEEPLSLVVQPKPLPVQAQSILRARFTGDDIPDPKGEPKGDRVDMRRYSPGDPPRLLLWKVYARTGKLMVRVPEAAITTAPRTCAYLVAGPGDETLASLARTIVEENLLGQGWKFAADGSERSVGHYAEALRLIARSGNPGVASGEGLASFLSTAHGEGFGSCLVLVPPTEGEWVEKVATSISRSPLAISLLTVGSVAQKEEEPKWRRWVFYEEKRKTDPSELLSRLNSPSVTDWLTYEEETCRLIPLKAKFRGKVGS